MDTRIPCCLLVFFRGSCTYLSSLPITGTYHEPIFKPLERLIVVMTSLGWPSRTHFFFWIGGNIDLQMIGFPALESKQSSGKWTLVDLGLKFSIARWFDRMNFGPFWLATTRTDRKLHGAVGLGNPLARKLGWFARLFHERASCFFWRVCNLAVNHWISRMDLPTRKL